jgi:fluoroquinolone resistance protein
MLDAYDEVFDSKSMLKLHTPHATPLDFKKSHFESCRFEGLHWSIVDLRGARFIDCTFVACDLSNAQVIQAVFNGVSFSKCKLLGVRWDTCSTALFQVTFDRCAMRDATFHGVHGDDFSLAQCDLSGCDFSDASFRKADFSGTTLRDAIFDVTDLRGANFTDAQAFVIPPARNRLKGARFNADNLAGLLTDHDLNLS